MKIVIAAVAFALVTSSAIAAVSQSTTIEHIRHPGQQVAGTNCTQTCQRIGNQVVCTQHCY
jgi:hypothetical protein